MKSLESKVGALALEYIQRIKRNQITTQVEINGRVAAVSLIEYDEDQYIIDGDDFMLRVRFDYSATEIEPEQKGDWFTPSFPAEYIYQIQTVEAFAVLESGDEVALPLTKIIERLTAEVVINLVIE